MRRKKYTCILLSVVYIYVVFCGLPGLQEKEVNGFCLDLDILSHVVMSAHAHYIHRNKVCVTNGYYTAV